MKRALLIRSNDIERVIPLQNGRYPIGRDGHSAIQIESHKVSKHHAEIVVEGNVVRLVDLGSANGTEINGTRIQERVLQDGDCISIGGVQLKFQDAQIQPIPAKPRSLRLFITLTICTAFTSISVIGGYTFYRLLQARLESSALAHAHTMVRYLAEKNREDLRLGNELLLNVDVANAEVGVREASIVNAKKRILAPFAKINQIDQDPFVTEALEHKSDQPLAASPQLSNGTRILVHPIRAYSDTLGGYETLGVAKITYSTREAIGSMTDANLVILLMVGISLTLSFVMGWKGSQFLTTQLIRLSERLHQARLRLPQRDGGIQSAPFREWEPLYEAIARVTEE